MKTRTIYNACNRAANRWHAGYSEVAERQFRTFERELLRRMDERDAWHTMFPVSTPAEVAQALRIKPFRGLFLTPKRIGQYMAGMSDGLKADDIFPKYPPKEIPD